MNADFGSGFNSFRVKNRVDLSEKRTKSVKNRERKGLFLFSVPVVNEEEDGPISSEISVLTIDIPASIDGSDALSIDVLFLKTNPNF